MGICDFKYIIVFVLSYFGRLRMDDYMHYLVRPILEVSLDFDILGLNISRPHLGLK